MSSILQALFYADQLLNKAPVGTQEAVIAMTTDRIRSPGVPLGPIQTSKQVTSKVF